MSSSSKTSDSQNQTSSLPISASASNAFNGVTQYYFNDFLTNNREAELFQTTQHSFLSSSSSSQNYNTAMGSGRINNSTENAASSGSAVSLDLQQSFSAENPAYLSKANSTPSFHGFDSDLPFIDDNGYHDGIQTFSYPNNDMFLGNQYVPNFDFGSENTSTGYISCVFDQANGLSSAPSTSQTSADVNVNMFTSNLLDPSNTTEYQSALKGKAVVQTNVSVDFAPVTSDSSTLGLRTDNNAILDAGFGQRSSASEQLISTAGYREEAIPNARVQAPSTSNAPYAEWNRPLNQMGERYDGISMGTYVDPTLPTPQKFTPSPTTNRTIAPDENIPVTPTTSPAQTKRRYAKKPLPSDTLYTRQNGKYICQYKGPARPEGCSVKTADVRNLCRHLRNHARKEKKMNIPQEERVACNGVPGESLYLEVSCPFKKEADRGKCRFIGRREQYGR
ncbi:hypothetical protein Clacol_002084 [Clathrus columnatus]|uniref:Uncharacterized protein n=1 Tax=Clathrus columnatus TaxID=1419009 RepID=A0AAV5A315_9AGAM|nr:hypothetical protein Clacol_002084 [Clathrus columnatus]